MIQFAFPGNYLAVKEKPYSSARLFIIQKISILNLQSTHLSVSAIDVSSIVLTKLNNVNSCWFIVNRL